MRASLGQSNRTRAPHVRIEPERRRRWLAHLRVEPLETRGLLTASSPGAPAAPVETLDRAIAWNSLGPDSPVEASGTLGQGADGSTDVQWYSFTLDQASTFAVTLRPSTATPAFLGVLSLYNNDPLDFADPYAGDGHRLLEQDSASSPTGVAQLDRTLAPGTYDLAISGAGNLDFHPLIAGSGLPGSTGSFDLQASLTSLGLAPSDGPTVVNASPTAGSSLSASPLAIRLDLSAGIDPSTLIANQTATLSEIPLGAPADTAATNVPLASVNFSTAIDELQLFPASPLAPGHYVVTLLGDASAHDTVIASSAGTPLGADSTHSTGADFHLSFDVNGIDGVTGATTSDDTAATARDLGDITNGKIVRATGAIGVDPTSANPANQVDLYHFEVTGSDPYAFVAEVDAGRVGSPLDPGVSLWREDPSTGNLVFVAGDNNTYNPQQTTDGSSTPLFTDAALSAGLTAGSYYLAVSSGSNTPSPDESLPVGTAGLFNPNLTHSGTLGSSTGPYVLSFQLHQAGPSPTVTATSIPAGATLSAPPTTFSVQFNQPVNIPILAFETFQRASTTTVSAITISGPDGKTYFPRFLAYDNATNTATFRMLDGLAPGAYVLHLTGADGLTDLAGTPLAGNVPNGDYQVPFVVAGPARGIDGNPLEYAYQPTLSGSPQDLGVLFPHELQTGVTITRTPTPSSTSTTDSYEIQVLQEEAYTFTLSGSSLPPGAELEVTDSSGKDAGLIALDGGKTLFGELPAGTYIIKATGWTRDQAPAIAYAIDLTFSTSPDNAPPLLAGPAPELALRFATVSDPITSAGGGSTSSGSSSTGTTSNPGSGSTSNSGSGTTSTSAGGSQTATINNPSTSSGSSSTGSSSTSPTTSGSSTSLAALSNGAIGGDHGSTTGPQPFSGLGSTQLADASHGSTSSSSAEASLSGIASVAAGLLALVPGTTGSTGSLASVSGIASPGPAVAAAPGAALASNSPAMAALGLPIPAALSRGEDAPLEDLIGLAPPEPASTLLAPGPRVALGLVSGRFTRAITQAAEAASDLLARLAGVPVAPGSDEKLVIPLVEHANDVATTVATAPGDPETLPAAVVAEVSPAFALETEAGVGGASAGWISAIAVVGVVAARLTARRGAWAGRTVSRPRGVPSWPRFTAANRRRVIQAPSVK
jgi:methionine-rich copper-binding protein CopC